MTLRIGTLVVAAGFLSGTIVAISNYLIHGKADEDKMTSAAVTVKTKGHVTIDQFGDTVWEPGSGVAFPIPGTRCEFLTGFHVVATAVDMKIFPRGWEDHRSGIRTRVLLSSPRHDVAVLQSDSCQDIGAAKFGNSDKLRIGDNVYTVGNPQGINPHSMRDSMIAGFGFDLSMRIPMIRLDGMLSPGQSGGPLFNDSGEIVGMVTSLLAGAGDVREGIGYATPINYLSAVVEFLKKGSQIGHAGIEKHITFLTEEKAKSVMAPGRALLIVSPPDEPAKNILFLRDAIYEIEGARIVSLAHTLKSLSLRSVGETISFNLVRGGKRIEAEVVLKKAPGAQPRGLVEGFTGLLGMELVSKEEMGEGVEALDYINNPIIKRVYDQGPAHLASIRSSQHTGAVSGPYFLSILYEVRVVKGVYVTGVFKETRTRADVIRMVVAQFGRNEPAMIEVETLVRKGRGVTGLSLGALVPSATTVHVVKGHSPISYIE